MPMLKEGISLCALRAFSEQRQMGWHQQIGCRWGKALLKATQKQRLSAERVAFEGSEFAR